MLFSFHKVDMYTGSGFVLDSFEALQSHFVETTSEDDFGADFLTLFRTRHGAVKAPAARLRRGAVAQITQQLYTQMDAVGPLLDKLEVRLGLIPARELTVSVKSLEIGKLRQRLTVRDAEGASALLSKLNQAIAANLPVLTPKGHKAADTDALRLAEARIGELNRQQNGGLNDAIGGTADENAVLAELDQCVRKVMKTARKLFKRQPALRRQFEHKALMARMHAGEKPKPRGADGQEEK